MLRYLLTIASIVGYMCTTPYVPREPRRDPSKGSINMGYMGLPEPSSLRVSALGTRAAEHKGCNWGMQVDWWLQPCAVFGHRLSGIIWPMPQKLKSIQLHDSIVMAIPQDSIILHYILHFICSLCGRCTVQIESNGFWLLCWFQCRFKILVASTKLSSETEWGECLSAQGRSICWFLRWQGEQNSCNNNTFGTTCDHD